MNHSLSVVIPVFNAETTLSSLVASLERTLSGRVPAYEIILVNDGSRDSSWAQIEAMVQRSASVRGIDLARNCGQHNATLAGIQAARHEVIVTLDDDGQHPPEEIIKLLAKLSEGYDVAYGYSERSQHGGIRGVVTRLVRSACERLSLFPDASKMSAFRAFRADLRKAFAHCSSPYVIVDELLQWGTNRIAFIHVIHKPRQGGVSSASFNSLIILTMNALTSHAITLVRFLEAVGLCVVLIGGLTVIVTAKAKLYLWGVIGIAVGIVLIAIGLVGEYVARLYLTLIGQPQFYVREERGAKR